MKAALSNTSRRALIGAVDQAVSSLSNALLAVVVARQTPIEEFGSYALAFSLYSFATGLTRSVSLQPYTVRLLDEENSKTTLCASAALCFALGGSLWVGIGGAIFGATTIVVLALGLPGLLLQDSWRGIFVANRAPEKAIFGTLLYVAITAVGFAFAVHQQSDDAATYVAIWGGAATVSAIFGFVQARTFPNHSGLKEFFGKNTDLTRYMASEWVLSVGLIQLATFGVAAVASTSVVAGVRGAQTLLGPLNILSMSMVNMAVPDLSRSRPNRKAALKAALAISGLVAFFGLLLSSALLILPDSWGVVLLGESWQMTTEALPGMSLWIVALGAASGPIVVLRVWERARTSFLINSLCGSIVLLAAPTLAFSYGVTGAALGFGLGTSLTLGIWWAALIAAGRTRDGSTSDQVSAPRA